MLSVIPNSQDSHHATTSNVSAASLSQADHSKPRLLLAATGSVATIKLPQIINALAHYRIAIRVILTQAATTFLAGQTVEQPTLSSLQHLPNVEAVYLDSAEWDPKWRRGAPILHIELRKWADLLCIAPLSANELAKITNGICDNLVNSVVRAWDTTGAIDGRKRRIIVAPAMNTAMYLHPITARQLKILEEEWGGEEGWFDVLRPIEKSLACGDVGVGAMQEWRRVVEAIKEKMGLKMVAEEDVDIDDD